MELPPDFYPREYDIENDPHFNVDDMNFFLGERRSGKSTEAMKWNLVRRRLYPIVYCFSKTAHNGYWQQVLPNDKIAGALSDDDLEVVLADILHTQVKRMVAWKQWARKRVRGNPIVKIIFEDYVTDKSLKHSKALQEMCYNGRHYGISCDILAQDHCGMTGGQRDNMDRWIIYRPDSARIRNMLRETFTNAVLHVAERVWEDGRALVINKKKRIPLAERLAWTSGDPPWIKAAIHKGLRLGCARTWNGIDHEKQKKEFPWIELPSHATLAAQFNKKIEIVGDDESGESEEGEEPKQKHIKLET